MSYIQEYADGYWEVFVRIQDGTENCGAWPSKEEAIQAWARAEEVLNHRKQDWLKENQPPIYMSDACFLHSEGKKPRRKPRKKPKKPIAPIKDLWDML